VRERLKERIKEREKERLLRETGKIFEMLRSVELENETRLFQPVFGSFSVGKGLVIDRLV